MRFIGRTKELDTLDQLLKKKSASFVVIRGRRRIGKSRLIQEFCKGKQTLLFSGLAPVSGITKQRQIDAFAKQLCYNFGMPKLSVDDWSDLFWHLGNQCKTGEWVVVLDEISWMGSKDPDFLGHLKNIWDLHFSKNEKLILIVCGSVSSWIDKNILSSTGFLGRISIDMVLKELTIAESGRFWGKYSKNISAIEKFKFLSVTGGVPKYLEEMIPGNSAESNITSLCFHSNGLLYREFNQIFSDLFFTKMQIYKSIVKVLGEGEHSLDQLAIKLEVAKGGSLSAMLQELILAGFVSEDATWSIKTGVVSKLKNFRLCDNYLRFYVKYIEPNRAKIEKGLFSSKSLANLPGWEAIMGLQFENLVLNNLSVLCPYLGIEKEDIIMAGPFFQRATKRFRGCQIDCLIQTRFSTLYLCEIKFLKNRVNKEIIQEVEQKIDRLSIPRGFSIRPVLIHVNGVMPSVIEEGFFSTIVDFSELFN
ncbi:MAG: ATP-binding protein [Rhabdochlamydiaceae bacterium]|nr:ATP-binding protein [Candidatus Amphrikana amoebophyrae]